MTKKLVLAMVLVLMASFLFVACESSSDGTDGDAEDEQADGDQVDGDQVDGDQVDGDQVDGDDADGDDVDGDDTDGDDTDGDDTDGDDTDGDDTDGDDTDGDDTDGDDTDGDDTDGDDEGDTEEPPVCTIINEDYTNTVLVFGAETTTPLEGATVTALWNHDGTPIDGVDPVVTGADGAAVFVGLPMCDDRKTAFKIEGPSEDWVVTYMFELNIDIPGFPLWAVTTQTYTLAPLAAGITVVPGKTVVAGGTYFMEPDGQGSFTNVPIGCSSVEADPAGGDVRYFDDAGLPTTLAGRANVNPLNGRYLIANLEPGETSILTKIDGNTVNSTRLVGFPDSICIASMLLFGAENPMPLACE